MNAEGRKDTDRQNRESKKRNHLSAHSLGAGMPIEEVNEIGMGIPATLSRFFPPRVLSISFLHEITIGPSNDTSKQ